MTGGHSQPGAYSAFSGYPLPSEGNGHFVRSAFPRGPARNGRPEYLKELNTLIVLELRRCRSTISRADVARETGRRESVREEVRWLGPCRQVRR